MLRLPRKTACEVFIYIYRCTIFWGPSLADWGVSGSHREVEDRPGVPFETKGPWDSSEASGILQESSRESSPLRGSVGVSTPALVLIPPCSEES